MKHVSRIWMMRFWVGLWFLLVAFNVIAHEETPYELQDVGIDEHLGYQIDPQIEVMDELGNTQKLSSFFQDKKPILLTLVYYQCPNLCNMILNGVLDTLKQMPWTVGEQFKIITLSFDPSEQHPLAAQKQKSHLTAYGRNIKPDAWRFLTATPENIKKITEAVGFKYKYDKDQFAHTAAIFILSPSGKITRYLYGITYRPNDLKLALLEASQGKVGNIVDKFLLFCYHYDPQGRGYTVYAANLMKLGGVMTIVIIIGFLIKLSKNKKVEAEQ